MGFMSWLRGPSEYREEAPYELPPAGSGVIPPSRMQSQLDPLNISAVYRAVTIITTAVMQLSVDVWRGKAPLDVPLFIRKPNPDVYAANFYGQTATSMATHGNAFWRVYRNSKGQPDRLELLDPTLCHLNDNGTLTVSGLKTPLAASAFRLIPLMVPVGRKTALGPIQAAAQELSAIHDLRSFSNHWFGNGDIPTGVLKSDQVLTADQAAQYKEVWEARQAREVAVLGSGLNYTPILISPKDAQFLELRQFSTTEIARMFGVPAHLLLASVDGVPQTYANIQQADLSFMRWTLAQYTIAIEQALSSLLPTGQTARFNLDAILRPDAETRYRTHASALTAGWITKNEVRAIEGLPPMEETPEKEESAPAENETKEEVEDDSEEV